jgi:DNA polymerase-4
MPGFCRDCFCDLPKGGRCLACGSPRTASHPRIDTLSIAHIDCDAFYAAIEKRDNPSLADRPLIIGGGQRGVVSTACYIARTYGVRSAMPMFKALALCPNATVLRPDMRKYVEVGREVRRKMQALTPLVEPLSIDEAFLDLSGTEKLHRMSAARSLARFAKSIEEEIGISVSVGLSANKFLAKIASDLDKPRGFSVLSPDEAPTFLANKSVSFIWGIGKATEAKLKRDGYATIADLQHAEETELMRRYGAEGLRLSRLSRGIDVRRVSPDRDAKTVSAETTFNTDTGDLHTLERILWELSERVSARLKAAAIAGPTVTLKLKTSDFKLRTRAATLSHPTLLANEIFDAGRQLLGREVGNVRFRLIGIGVSNFVEAKHAVRDMIETKVERTSARETAIDRLREKFGKDAVVRGIAFDRTKR